MSNNGQAHAEYAQFRKTYFEECAEILADLDERFSRFQAEAVDREGLNAIFRAVHSIKAGAGAFNFTDLVKFTHTLEALLDQLRDGRIEADENVLNLLVRAGDIVAEFVEAARQERSLGEDYGADIEAALQEILDESASSGANSGAVKSKAAKQAAPVTEFSDDLKRYSISFKPLPELFRHANEPLLLIRELKGLGELIIKCDYSAVPNLQTLDPEDSHMSWAFELVTKSPATAIREVFEFVDQDCDLIVEDVSGDGASGKDGDDAAELGNPDLAAAAKTKTAASAQTQAQNQNAANGGKGLSSIRVDLSRVDRLVNMVGELVITQAMLSQQMADLGLGGQRQQLSQGHEDLATYTRELQECVMAIRMQPVKSVFARMPRLVRDISAKIGKKVRLITSGDQTEVDKTVIEELADPLTHMIRNAIDHGIEDRETRLATGKPEEGTIELSASQRAGNILIQLTDDGAGIDRSRLLAKAIEKGIVAEDAKLTPEEIDELIFAPGFSTAKNVTDLSGRGVGMDVVRRNIHNLGGRIQIQSTHGKGTRFTLIIPLTLAVLDGMVVAVGEEKYILPLTSIVESIRPEQQQVRSIADAGRVISIRGEFIPLISIYRVFNIATSITEPSKGIVVVIETEGGSKIGVVVDELIGQQQVVVKSLLDNFDPVPGISGATILGNGRVALILDIEALAQLPQHRVSPVSDLNRLAADADAAEVLPAMASELLGNGAQASHVRLN